ncbi:MAG: hypothetical protein SF187_23560 [Deltaproteobacteria bacterium]|nr:hypothetical protein [Deltaproteobacteria bacterium]
MKPDQIELAIAQRWATAYVKRRGIFGKLVGTALAGDSVGEPATASLMTASIPILIAIAKRALRSAEKEGAPRDPRTSPPAIAVPDLDADDQDPQTLSDS